MMRKPFEETVMYQKGQLAEYIIDKILLEATNFVPYRPVEGVAHPFDRLIVTQDKKTISALEIKAVSARDYYPDTGISIQHYRDYLYVRKKYGFNVFIAFVDSKNREIYGNILKELDKPTVVEHTLPSGKTKTLEYPKNEENFTAVGGYIRYFPLENMKRNIFNLTKEQAEELESNSNYGYKRDVSYKKGYRAWKEAADTVASAATAGRL